NIETNIDAEDNSKINKDTDNEINKDEETSDKNPIQQSPESDELKEQETEDELENKKEELENTSQTQSIQKSTLSSKSTSELKKGDNNANVKKLKQDLAKLGFVAAPNPNGYFGVQTEKKVKEFQTYYGLKSTGIANKATLDKIKAVLASPLQKGISHNDVIKLKQDLDTLGFKVVNNP